MCIARKMSSSVPIQGAYLVNIDVMGMMTVAIEVMRIIVKLSLERVAMLMSSGTDTSKTDFHSEDSASHQLPNKNPIVIIILIICSFIQV